MNGIEITEFFEYFQSFSCGNFFFNTKIKDGGASICKLSIPVLLQIVYFLDFEDILNFGIVCKYTSTIFKEKVFWEKISSFQFHQKGDKSFFIQNFKLKKAKIKITEGDKD